LADPVAAAPLAATDYGLASAAIQMAVALLCILVVIFFAYWLLRRFGHKIGLGPGGRGGMLRLMANLTLGPRKSIIVVRFMNKDLVLGVTDQTITLLTEGNVDHDTQNDFADALAQKTRPADGDPTP
jgi:flagellar protein FliO/FliZ